MKERSNQKLGHTHTDKNKRRPSKSLKSKSVQGKQNWSSDDMRSEDNNMKRRREEMLQVIHTWEKTSKKKNWA